MCPLKEIQYEGVDGHRKLNCYMRDITIHGRVPKSLFYCDPHDRAFHDHTNKHNSEANMRTQYETEETMVDSH